MKRLSIMGTLASLAFAALCFFAPASAQAACTAVNTGAYPADGHSFYCTGAVAADVTTMDTGLTTSGLGLNELRTAYSTAAKPGIQFYIFGTPAEYEAQFPTYAVPGTYDFGVVNVDTTSTNRPTFVAIFKTNLAGQTNTQIGNWAAFYAGRASDALLGYMAHGGVIITPYPNMSMASGSYDDFNLQLQHDFSAFDALTNCGTNGVFRGQKDPTKTTATYICTSNGTGNSLNTGYSGSNHAILQQIWPNAFGLGINGYFAELAAYTGFDGRDSGNTGLSKDYYFQPTGLAAQFVCSKALVNFVYNNGQLPTSAQLPSGCPSMVVKTACTKIFDSTKKYPGDGYLFSCTGETLPQVGTNLDGLSATVQTNLEGYPSIAVYVFKDVAAYTTAITAAGLTPASPAIPNYVVGYNYLDTHGAWFVLIFENYNTQAAPHTYTAATVAQETENGDHELGHVLDFILGGYASNSQSSNYVGLVQHDWLYLDYSTVNQTSQAMSTQRDPCGTSSAHGPFYGLTDPTTGVAFCNGSNKIETKWTVGQLGVTPLLNSYILQQTSAYIFTEQQLGTWGELFAEEFFWIAQPSTTGGGWYAVALGIYDNTQFECSTLWLDDIWNGTANPPTGTPPSCTATIPTWYQNIMPH